MKTSALKDRQRKWDAYHRFEKEELKKEKLSFKKALAVFEMLWSEAIMLGVLKNRDPLEGIEKNMRIARILNTV